MKILKLVEWVLIPAYGNTYATTDTYVVEERPIYIPVSNVCAFEPVRPGFKRWCGTEIPQPAIYVRMSSGGGVYLKSTCEQLEKLMDESIA